MLHLTRFTGARIVAVLLALVLLAAMFPAVTVASLPANGPGGSGNLTPQPPKPLTLSTHPPQVSPLGTTVTEYIYTAQELYSDLVGPDNTASDSGYCYELENDVDLSVYGQGYTSTNGSASWTGWDPIGDGSGGVFNGHFYGNGHTISNLYINASPGSLGVGGLFGYIGSGAVVDSVYLDNVSINIDAGGSNGGLASCNSGSITNCYATGSISGNTSYSGGLVGYNSGSIAGCYATDSISEGGPYSGGLVGYNNGPVTGCYATGSVCGISLSGGLVGLNSSTITGCYATGSANGEGTLNGGLAGINFGTITNSYATGSVSGGDGSQNGGLVGYNDGEGSTASITDCYATGTVSGGSNSFNGGLVGENDSNNGYAYITDSYCLTANGQSAIGEDGGGPGPSGQPNNSDHNSLTTAEMQTESTYKTDSSTPWDFTSTWGINNGYSYPFLQQTISPLPTVNASVSPAAGGTVNGLASYQGTYNVSDMVYLVAAPKTGYTFTGWTVGGSTVTSAVYTFTMTASNVTMTANFTTPVTTAAISGVTPPVTGATPVTSVADNGQYTASVSWSPTVSGTFAANTQYTAYITITPDSGYTLTGVSANFFTVSGATSVSNAANSGTVTAVFPATAAASSGNTTISSGGGGAPYYPTPSVETEAATSVTATSAVLSGDITSDNGFDVTDYGFLGGTSASSLTNKLDVGTNNQSGAFTGTLSSLTAGTTYYFEAYATNSQGTADGAPMSFTTTAAATPTAPSFSDVPSSYWAYNAISSLSSQGIASGYPDGTFKPDNDITRAEFCAMLVKALGLTGSGTGSSFTDVAPSDWCYGSVNTAVYAGLAFGMGDHLFAPNALVTREQMAVMIANALGSKAPAVNGTELNAFTDKAEVSTWAVTDVEEAVKAGIISGITPTTLAPLDNATRAQAAEMIYKLLGFLGK